VQQHLPQVTETLAVEVRAASLQGASNTHISRQRDILDLQAEMVQSRLRLRLLPRALMENFVARMLGRHRRHTTVWVSINWPSNVLPSNFGVYFKKGNSFTSTTTSSKLLLVFAGFQFWGALLVRRVE
jgi:hypothetical protein